MHLLAHQKNEAALRNLACAAIELLVEGKLDLLAERFGYAVAFERKLVEAIRDDLAEALAKASGTKLLTVASSELSVVYYCENSTQLIAAIDCDLPTDGYEFVCVSFVVSGMKEDQFLTLEDISASSRPE